MILLPGAVRMYFATAPVNLRRSFDGLSNEVRAVLGRDPLSGLGLIRFRGHPTKGGYRGKDGKPDEDTKDQTHIQ